MINENAKPYMLNGEKDVAVLLVHGFTSSPSCFGMLSDYLNKAGYTVSVPLLPGHGVTKEYHKDFGFDHWTKFVVSEVEALREKGFKKVVAIGHSLGGCLSLYLAQLGIVDAVVPIAPAIYLQRGKRIKFFSTYFKNQYVSMGADEKWSEGVFRYYHTSGKALGHLVQTVEYVRKRLETIDCPILVVSAKYDKKVKPKGGLFVYNTVKSSVKDIIHLDTGHSCIEDEKDLYFHKIVDFLGKI